MSCSTKYVSITERAVDEFHERLRSLQDERIISDATPEFQKSMRAESRVFFVRIRKTLGTPRRSRPISVHVNHMPAGTFIAAQYETSFEKGDAQEDFTWRIQEGKPLLLGYHVSSPLLLTDPATKPVTGNEKMR